MARPQALAETAITDLCNMSLATRHPATPPPPMTTVPTGTSGGKNRWRWGWSNEVFHRRSTWSTHINFPIPGYSKELVRREAQPRWVSIPGWKEGKGDKNLASENQIINKHKARVPNPGLLFPFQMAQQLNSSAECLRAPLGSASFLSRVP